MQISIISENDQITLTDRPHDPRCFASIISNGASGVYGTPAVRETVLDRPQMSGAYWPSRLTQGARTISLDCIIRKCSTLDAARMRDRINAFVGQELQIVLEDVMGRREISGWMSADPEPLMSFRMQSFKFALVITCPDPEWLGDWVWVKAAHGSATLTNEGNAPTWPFVQVFDSMSRIKISNASGLIVEWNGDAVTGWSLDFRDALPSHGKLTQGQVFSIPPGAHTLTVDTDAHDVNFGIQPAWR